MRKFWTKLEDNFLRRNVNRLATYVICERLRRTKHSVAQHRKKLGLKRTVRLARPPKNAWSKEEIKFLRRNLNKMTCREIGKAIGRSKIAVAGRIHVFGFKRNPKARKQMMNHFPKGYTPWNKNKKGIHLSRKTEFKKGHLPWNTYVNGYHVNRVNPKAKFMRGHWISIRWHIPTKTPYKFIRVAIGKWELLSRWKWEKYRGKIPPSYVVAYKNGDTLDCRMSNLFLLSRAENARRNRNDEKFRKTMKRVWDEGRFYDSDKYIAFTLAPKDERLRKELKKHPALLEAKRANLKLRRRIKNATRTTA